MNIKRIFRFIKALVRYLIYGNRVTLKEYGSRINICSECHFLDGEKWSCGVCGCYVDKKAKMSTEECPYKKW